MLRRGRSRPRGAAPPTRNPANPLLPAGILIRWHEHRADRPGEAGPQIRITERPSAKPGKATERDNEQKIAPPGLALRRVFR